MAAANADLTKDIPQILEGLVLANIANIRPSGVSALAALAAVPLKAAYIISYTVDLPSQAANTGTFTETTITDTSHTVQVAVGDLFIPFAVSTLNAGLVLGPAAARTAHKAIISNNNVTIGALDAASATVSSLWLKVA